MNTRWAEKYLTIPYAEEGSSLRGCNCWGLVHLVLKGEANIETSPYTEISPRELRRVERTVSQSRGIAPWQHKVEVGSDRPFDVVVFKGLIRGRPFEIHTGVVTEPGMCLHMDKEAGVVHVPYYDSTRRKCNIFLLNRLVGIFRHEALSGVVYA